MLARFVTSCVVVAVAGLALMPEAASAQKRGGTLVMLVQPEPPTLASNISTPGPIGQVATKVYEDLLEYDFALKPVPGLAESWTVSPDGRTITFRRTFGEGQDSSHDEAPGNLWTSLGVSASPKREDGARAVMWVRWHRRSAYYADGEQCGGPSGIRTLERASPWVVISRT